MPNHESFMREAIAEARQALQEGELPIGCVITYNNEIIARGHNEREQTGDPTAHAEVVAMRRAAKHLKAWAQHEYEKQHSHREWMARYKKDYSSYYDDESISKVYRDWNK